MTGKILNREELHRTYGGEIRQEYFWGAPIIGQIYNGWKCDNICAANIKGKLALKNKTYKEHD